MITSIPPVGIVCNTTEGYEIARHKVSRNGVNHKGSPANNTSKFNQHFFDFLSFFIFFLYLLIYLFTETKASFNSLKFKGGIMKLMYGLQFYLYQMAPTTILSIFLVFAYPEK